MSAPAEQITTTRLRLILITPDDAADMLAGRRQSRWHPGYPREDDRDAVAGIKTVDPWGPRHIVWNFQAVGSIGFFGPPDEDAGHAEVEVGYGLVEAARGHGLGGEALRAMLAEADRLRVRVRAHVLPDNRASLRLLAGCGFTELRGANEDGELGMARPLPPAPASPDPATP